MNPRYSRLLIPGLLLLLLVVVLVSSLARRADGTEAAPQVVSHLTDPRITESSGLALSRAHDGIAYTINDSGNEPLIFAVDVATGSTVGTTRVAGGALVDTEALAIDRSGVLWVADTGDNLGDRRDAALYAVPEQGRGDHSVTAKRYPVAYGSAHPDVEALLIHPVSGAKYLVSKELRAGVIYALPQKLSTEQPNVATGVPESGPSLVTDATFTADGKSVVMRTYTSLFLVDPVDWSVLTTAQAPRQQQGETITAEARSLLVGSEGTGSELIRVQIPSAASTPTPTPTPSPSVSPTSAGERDDDTIAPMLFVFGAVVAAGVLGAGVAYVVRRSR